jgi:hypothetical protein
LAIAQLRPNHRGIEEAFMMRALFIAVVAFWPLVALAQVSPARVMPLYEAMGLPEVIGIMREEGLAYGASIEEQMFPQAGGAAWRAAVERIYDVAVMDRVLRDGLAEILAEDGIDAMEDFFASDRGRRIVALEVSARRAMLDEAVEEESRAAAEDLRASGDPRVELVGRFSEANQLVDQNVAGALNANLAFYQGLDEGQAFPGGMSEAEILADVWRQEPEVRADTEGWVQAYLLMAYAPLETGDLEAYIAFSETPEGQALNRALFGAFDAMFTGISRDLGRAAARFMVGEQL